MPISGWTKKPSWNRSSVCRGKCQLVYPNWILAVITKNTKEPSVKREEASCEQNSYLFKEKIGGDSRFPMWGLPPFKHPHPHLQRGEGLGWGAKQNRVKEDENNFHAPLLTEIVFLTDWHLVDWDKKLLDLQSDQTLISNISSIKRKMAFYLSL